MAESQESELSASSPSEQALEQKMSPRRGRKGRPSRGRRQRAQQKQNSTACQRWPSYVIWLCPMPEMELESFEGARQRKEMKCIDRIWFASTANHIFCYRKMNTLLPWLTSFIQYLTTLLTLIIQNQLSSLKWMEMPLQVCTRGHHAIGEQRVHLRKVKLHLCCQYVHAQIAAC